MLHRCSKDGYCISIVVVKNVYENYYLEDKLLRTSSFSVLKELVFLCSFFSKDLKVGRIVSWTIKKIHTFISAGSILCVEITQKFEDLDTRTNQYHNIKFLGKKVKLIHQCSLEPSYIAKWIVLNVLEGDVQFVLLCGNEFGVLV